MNGLQKAVFEFLTSLDLSPGCGLLVACSGGPDSVALLHAVTVSRVRGLLRVGCVHVNHGIRSCDEHLADRILVEKHAEALGIPFYYRAVTPGVLSESMERRRHGMEAAARRVRYAFFSDVASQHQYRYVAVGHTLDDQIETVIQRVFQGSGWGGLSGIPERNGRIVRPLLSVPRERVGEYLRENELSFRRDPSNESTEYLRNRIRAELVPRVKNVFPGFRSAVLSLSEKAALVEDFVRRTWPATLRWQYDRAQPLDVTGARMSIPLSAFIDAHPVLRLESLYHVVNEVKGAEPSGAGIRTPYSFLRGVALMTEAAEGVITSGHGVRFAVEDGVLTCSREVVFAGENGYLLAVQELGSLRTGIRNTLFSVRPVDLPVVAEASVVVPEAMVEFPLLIRPRRPGDLLNLPEGSKTLKKLFNEWDVPPSERWKIPVFQDRTGLVAVGGALFGYENRFAKERGSEPADGHGILVEEV